MKVYSLPDGRTSHARFTITDLAGCECDFIIRRDYDGQWEISSLSRTPHTTIGPEDIVERGYGSFETAVAGREALVKKYFQYDAKECLRRLLRKIDWYYHQSDYHPRFCEHYYYHKKIMTLIEALGDEGWAIVNEINPPPEGHKI